MDKETRIWESLVAALVMALSATAWIVSASFPKGDNPLVGPAVFPRALSIILVIASAMVLLGSWRGLTTTGATEDAFSWSKLARVIGVLAALAVCPVLLAPLGLLVTTVLLTIAVCMLLGAKPLESLMASGVMLVFVYLVFILLLKVQTS